MKLLLASQIQKNNNIFYVIYNSGIYECPRIYSYCVTGIHQSMFKATRASFLYLHKSVEFLDLDTKSFNWSSHAILLNQSEELLSMTHAGIGQTPQINNNALFTDLDEAIKYTEKIMVHRILWSAPLIDRIPLSSKNQAVTQTPTKDVVEQTKEDPIKAYERAMGILG